MFWLCKILGHRHKISILLMSWVNPVFCYVCHARTPDEPYEGDPVWKCKILGHKASITQIDDFGDETFHFNCCVRCHRTI
jgi:hypothetical protein